MKRRVERQNSWLLALRTGYGPEFVQLCTNPEECVREWGPYHIRIATVEHVKPEEEDKLHERYDALEIVIPVERVTSG